MNLPIIIAAFGTTSKALATYQAIDADLHSLLPEREIIWTYTSRIISKALEHGQKSEIMTPDRLLQRLYDKGRRQVTVQSLHLLPGKEFHSLVRDVSQAPCSCSLGLPLLCSPQDYEYLAGMLAPIIEKNPDAAILILGHGTYHPSWTCYPALETIMRRRFGFRIFVGALEQYPQSGQLPRTIREMGYKKVCIIPFLLVAGMHFHRDIKGNASTTWEQQLKTEGISMEICGDGLGKLPGLAQLVAVHIQTAENSTQDDTNF